MKQFVNVFVSDSAAKDVQGIWMMKRAQNTVSLPPSPASPRPLTSDSPSLLDSSSSFTEEVSYFYIIILLVIGS